MMFEINFLVESFSKAFNRELETLGSPAGI